MGSLGYPASKVPKYLIELIFSHLQDSFKRPGEESDDASDIKTVCSFRGGEVLKKHNYSELVWSGVLK